MSSLKIIGESSVTQNVDATVNAANRGLLAGGGVCGAIFKAAGMIKLTGACMKIKTPLKDGDAVITPSFNLTSCKYIIHAVGPDFSRTPDAFKELYDAYYNSLVVLKDNGLRSIAFPLISSGIFGGNLKDPVGESTKQCYRAYMKFVQNFPDYEVDVLLCTYTKTALTAAERVLDELLGV